MLKIQFKIRKISRQVFFLSSVFCLLSSVFCKPTHAEPLTLEEAYRLALLESEDVAMKQQELEKAQGHWYQALDEVAPDINFLITESAQDAPREGESSSSGDTSTGNLTRRTTPQKKFTLHQPIFSGFKEIAGIQGSGAEKAQKKYEKRRVEETLLMDVVNTFYAVIMAEKDSLIFEDTKKTLENRMVELKERVEVGRSRESEIQTALSDEKQVESQLILSKRDTIIARQELEYYIGREVSGFLADPDADNPEIKDNDYYVNKVDSRFDVKAANEAYILAQKKVVAAQSGLFPSAYLDGGYYTQRVGVQSGIDWDVLLSVNVPIFNGTETIGDIKVAASDRELAKYNFLKIKRLARLDIRRAYEEYRSAKLEEAALKEAAEAKKKDYDFQVEEYKHNLVNNLDVLTALKDYQDLSRQWNVAHYTTKIKYWQLKVAVGETMDNTQ